MGWTKNKQQNRLLSLLRMTEKIQCKGTITRTRTVLVYLLIALTALRIAAAIGNSPKPKFTVHGRLSYYNGTPSCRIWVVGTKRILGVEETPNEIPAMPKKLHALMSWDRDVFADFVVEPLTPFEQGVMQRICVISASNVVVTESNKIVSKKKKL